MVELPTASVRRNTNNEKDNKIYLSTLTSKEVLELDNISQKLKKTKKAFISYARDDRDIGVEIKKNACEFWNRMFYGS